MDQLKWISFVTLLFLSEANGCGEHFRSKIGSFHSPNYPEVYGPSERCFWNITVSQGKQVKLEFDSFEVEGAFVVSPAGGCSHDFVKILDGHELGSPSLGTFCGANTPGIIVSSHNEMSVLFMTDGSIQYRGFKCTFSEIPEDPITVPVDPFEGIPCRNTEKIRSLSSRHFKGYCYWFTMYATGTWEESKLACKATLSILTSIHSFEELSFLKNMVSAERRSHIFWIGMKTSGIDSTQHWEDGTAVDFVLWKDDEFSEGNSDIGTCAYLDPETGFFGRTSCDETHLFICKSKDELLTDTPVRTVTTLMMSTSGISSPPPRASWITSPPPRTSSPLIINITILPAVCPDDWHTFGDKCYGIFGLQELDKETWTDANKQCLEMGATLISIHSQREQDFVSLMMAGKADMTWTGLQEKPSETDRAFHWSDGSAVDYTYWDKNQPNNWDGFKEECANMRFSSPHFGKWNDARCDSLQQSYICQIHIDPKKAKFAQDTDVCSKPEGWIKLNSSCYRVFNETENNVTWLQALSHCDHFGGSLVTVRSLRDTTFLRFHLDGQEDLFWIGMKNEGAHKRYSWITGPADYSNWDRGQPFVIPNKPNCVATNSYGRWSVEDCDENHPFICEVNEADFKNSTVAPQEPGMRMTCPSGSLKWTDYGGSSCYIIELTDQVTWYEAVHRCFKEGGFLASFHYLEEVNMILNQIAGYGNPLYIGLGQKHDGGFGWIDNSAVDFANWEPGQPSSKTQLCVEMLSRSGTWNDISCELKRGYICSISKISSNGSTLAPMAAMRSKEQGEHGIGVGAIIGILVGILMTIAILVAAYCYLYPSMKSVSKLTELENL